MDNGSGTRESVKAEFAMILTKTRIIGSSKGHFGDC